MVFRLSHFVGATIVSLLALSCATSSPAPVLEGVPNWVLNPPKDDGAETFFVANGTSESGDAVQAETRTVQDVKDRVLNSIGFKAIQDAPPALRAAIDTWSTQWDSLAQKTPEGVRVVDRFSARKANSVTVFWLVAVAQESLQRQKAKWTALNVSSDASKPIQAERDADQKLASGDVLGSIQLYVANAAAASAQSRSDLVDRSLDKAMAALGKIGLRSLGSGYSTSVGVPFASSLEVLATYGNAPLPNAPLRAAFTTRKNGKTIVVGASTKTNERGIATFAFPEALQPIKAEAIVVFDVNAYLEALIDLPRDRRYRIEAIEDWAAASRLAVPYTIVSQAKGVPLSVVTVDFDEKGAPLKRNVSSDPFAESLKAAGFTVEIDAALVDQNLVKTSSETALIAALKPKTAGRVAVAAFKVLDSATQGGKTAVRVSGTVKVVDVDAQTIVWTNSAVKREVDPDAPAAFSNAFVALATELATSIANELP